MHDVRKQAKLCHSIMNIKHELYSTLEFKYTLRFAIDTQTHFRTQLTALPTIIFTRPQLQTIYIKLPFVWAMLLINFDQVRSS